VRINPQTGQVIGEIDCSILRQGENSLLPKDVLNGIAYDAEGDRLFITGKNWPRIYEVVLKNAKNP
jgi:glutaminyl-peptide cyclotransferase